MLQETYQSTREKMDSCFRSLLNNMKRVRTGRASVSLLDPIRVMYYNAPTPINQIASLSVPESDLIVIQPWDITAAGDIVKAIQKSDLGINPANDGKVIRLKLPPLTEERRQTLAKQVRKMAEEAKIAMRNNRREANDAIRKALKAKELSEDDAHAGQGEVQKITNQFIAKVDEAAAEKEKEITTL